MTLLHLSTIRQPDGLFEIDILIDRRQYTYYISSSSVVDRFMTAYKRKATHGKAVAILNKFKLERIKVNEKVI